MKTTLKTTHAFGHIPAAALAALALGAALLATPAQAGKKGKLLTVPPGGFREGFQYELTVRCPTNGAERFAFTTCVTFPYVTSRGDGSLATNDVVRRVEFALGSQPGTLTLQPWFAPKWRAPVAYHLNPFLYEQTFASMDDAGRAEEREAAARRRDPRREKLLVSVRVNPDKYLFFVNGVFVVDLPREEEDMPGFSFPLNFQPDNWYIVDTSKPDPRWELVDISERTNAGGFGRRLAPAGTITNVAGVPFLLSRAPYEAVDLFPSRFAGALRLVGSLNTCGKRWQDPLLRTPLRYSFRVPGGEYDALYVLCASDGSRRDAIPRFTAQFYRKVSDHGSGRPFNFFSGTVPASTNGSVHVVRIPLSGDFRTELGPEPACFFELTKDVQPFQCYPDPEYYSCHAAGLPSSVRVLGVSLHRPETKVSFDPDEPGNAFVEGQKASYTATLENTTDASRAERLVFTAASWDGQKTVRQEKAVTLAPGERKEVKFAFAPQRYGWHAVRLEAAGRVFNHSAAYLKARDYTRRPFEHKGLRFGTWQMFESPAILSFLGKAGFDTSEAGRRKMADDDPLKPIWDRYGMAAFRAPGSSGCIWAAKSGDDFETNVLRVISAWGKARMGDPGSENWKYTGFLDEPGGIGTGNAQFPEYYGEPTNAFSYAKLSGKEKERYESYKLRMIAGAEALRRIMPGTKRLFPNGSWTFLIPYLQDPETRNLSDGVVCDFQFYNHIPEEQMHLTAPHSFMYFHDAWRKYRPGSEPHLVLVEGPDVLQVYPGASTPEEDASLRIRVSIHLAAYGVEQQLDWAMYPFSYPEFHCAGGLATGRFARDPNWGYCAMATWTRLTRDATFESFSPVGSTSAYCANFRNHRTGKLFRAIWTVRGKRDFVFPCAPGTLTVLDPMDNEVKALARDGGSVVTVGQMPYFILGADAAPPTVSPDPDHSDDALAATALPLGSLAEHFAAQTDDADDPYVNFFPDHLRRFKATMDVVATNDAAHGPVLSVGLPKQEVDRMVMPYYTCLSLKKPVPIPGKAKALRLDVKAASDWGRVVFVLRDASGRLYYSSGQKGSWNADDMGSHSFFCFDGWRRLKIALPSNAPWDAYRESGFATWGSDDPKAPVALPLAIEKLFVERRGGVMYGNKYVSFDHDTPVLLGALHVEYASEDDKGDEALRLSRLRLPPVSVSQMPNPIAEMAKANSLPAGRIVSVEDPETWFNGTNGDFTFELPEEAVSWEVWAARDKDGRGALRLGRDLKKNPCNVRGFLAGQTFHAFVVWRDKSGRQSKPSEPFEVRLEDHFAHQ